MFKHKVFFVLTIGLLLTLCFPPTRIFVSVGTSAILTFFIGVALLLFPSLLTKRTIIWVFVYTVLAFVYHLFGNAYFATINAVLIPFLCMMTGLVITEYAMAYDNDYKYTRMVFFTSVSLNVIMAIMTIPQIWINPNIIRDLGELYEGVGYFDATLSNFVISYTTVHGLPFILAPLVALCFKTYGFNKKIFLFCIFSLGILYYLIIKANAVMSFLISTMIVILALLFRDESFNRRNITKMILFGLLALALTNQYVMVPIINVVQGLTDEGGFTYARLDEIKTFMIYGESEGDLLARQERYDISQQLFWESPLTGTSKPELVSMHTWMWDMLAVFGIFFIMPLVMIFVSHIKNVYGRLIHSRVVYVFGVVAYLLMLYLKNAFGIGTWLYAFGVLPIV